MLTHLIGWIMTLLSTGAAPAALITAPGDSVHFAGPSDAFVHFADGQQTLTIRLQATAHARVFAVVVPVPNMGSERSVPAPVFEQLAARLNPPAVEIDLTPRPLRPRPRRAPTVDQAPHAMGRIGPRTVHLLPDAPALGQWRVAQGLTEGATLGQYATGWAFVVLRIEPVVADRPVTGFVGPIGVQFQSARPVLALIPTTTRPALNLYLLTAQGLVADAPLGAVPLRAVPEAPLWGPVERPLRVLGGALADVPAHRLASANAARVLPMPSPEALLGAAPKGRTLSIFQGQPIQAGPLSFTLNP
jgi:hypothetical protein